MKSSGLSVVLFRWMVLALTATAVLYSSSFGKNEDINNNNKNNNHGPSFFFVNSFHLSSSSSSRRSFYYYPGSTAATNNDNHMTRWIATEKEMEKVRTFWRGGGAKRKNIKIFFPFWRPKTKRTNKQTIKIIIMGNPFCWWSKNTKIKRKILFLTHPPFFFMVRLLCPFLSIPLLFFILFWYIFIYIYIIASLMTLTDRPTDRPTYYRGIL